MRIHGVCLSATLIMINAAGGQGGRGLTALVLGVVAFGTGGRLAAVRPSVARETKRAEIRMFLSSRWFSLDTTLARDDLAPRGTALARECRKILLFF